eukprot:TRINITY_DN7123_c0_g1_i1.p1 TRINITY_DN7123_c0_g1~~TRINITY_DN7123_c0_g1_i1.p1  ORF type:complete len:942 (+),score=201.70 TRINITY_DN7123_c0_g1_i1:300-2828(+)
MTDLQLQLSCVEDYLARTDGLHTLQYETVTLAVPSCVQEDLESANLYIGSLAPAWTEELISREFGRFGCITSIKIMYPRTGRQLVCGMSTGFVQYVERRQAEAAKAAMNGRNYFGMELRIEFSKPVAPTPVEAKAVTPDNPSEQQQQLALMPGKRRSKFDMAKTFSVDYPADRSLRHLIDRTAEFVAIEGWDFEKLLLERERDNPRFCFLWADEDQTEHPLHIYYRWRTFSFLQGDGVDRWRMEPFQIYTNGALWQPPPCVTESAVEEEATSAAVARVDLKGRPAASVIGGAGSAELSLFDQRTFDKILNERLGQDRRSILEGMAFCLDNAAASQAIARRLCASIVDVQASGSTVAQVVARLFLLSDVLHNAHCAKPGAAMYRRQIQEHLPDMFVRMRSFCDGLQPIAASSLRDCATQLLRVWASWSSFPRPFTQGLEGVLCHNTSAEDLVELRKRWDIVQDVATLERECRARGLALDASRAQLVERLCCYEAFWGERVAPEQDELEGEPLVEEDVEDADDELEAILRAWRRGSGTSTVTLLGDFAELAPSTDGAAIKHFGSSVSASSTAVATTVPQLNDEEAERLGRELAAAAALQGAVLARPRSTDTVTELPATTSLLRPRVADDRPAQRRTQGLTDAASATRPVFAGSSAATSSTASVVASEACAASVGTSTGTANTPARAAQSGGEHGRVSDRRGSIPATEGKLARVAAGPERERQKENEKDRGKGKEREKEREKESEGKGKEKEREKERAKESEADAKRSRRNSVTKASKKPSSKASKDPPAKTSKESGRSSKAPNKAKKRSRSHSRSRSWSPAGGSRRSRSRSRSRSRGRRGRRAS